MPTGWLRLIWLSAFFCARAACEIAEVVNRQRQVGGPHLADRFAVVTDSGHPQQLKVRLHPVGDLIYDIGAFGRAGVGAAVLGGMGGIQRRRDVGGIRTGDVPDRGAGQRRGVGALAPGIGRTKPAVDEVVIAARNGDTSRP